MATIPPYRFVTPWDLGRCEVDLRGVTFRVVHCPMVGRVWFRGMRDGREVAIRSRFTSLLRELDRQAAMIARDMPPAPRGLGAGGDGRGEGDA